MVSAVNCAVMCTGVLLWMGPDVQICSDLGSGYQAQLIEPKVRLLDKLLRMHGIANAQGLSQSHWSPSSSG